MLSQSYEYKMMKDRIRSIVTEVTEKESNPNDTGHSGLLGPGD